MKKTKKKKGVSGVKQHFKKNWKKMAIGTGIDAGGAILGGLLGHQIGRWAFWSGVGTFLIGNVIGEKGQILRSLGVGATAYGIAHLSVSNTTNSRESQRTGDETATQGVKNRLLDFKDNLMHATFLDKLFKNEQGASDESMGSVDLSELDAFEDYGNRQLQIQAYNEESQSDSMEYYANPEEVESMQEYAQIEELDDELIDFSEM